jgi:hypothetical protein
MNITQETHIRQEKNKIKSPPVWLQYFIQLLNEFFNTKNIKYLCDAIKRCPKMVKRTIALLLKMDNIYAVVNPAQEWMAAQIKCKNPDNHSYVSDMVQALADAGVLIIKNSGFIPAQYKEGVEIVPSRYTSNIYKFASWFYDHDVRCQIAGVLPGCQALEYSLLMVFERDIQSGLPCIEPKKPTLLRPSYVYNSNDITKCILVGDCKEAKMEPNRSMMIRSIESLKNTPMSEADVNAIAGYPDEVIRYADQCTNRKGHLANPIGYFLVCCREFNKKRLAKDVNVSSRLETRRESPQRGKAQSFSLEESCTAIMEKIKARKEADERKSAEIRRKSEEHSAALASQSKDDQNPFTRMLRQMVGC